MIEDPRSHVLRTAVRAGRALRAMELHRLTPAISSLEVFLGYVAPAGPSERLDCTMGLLLIQIIEAQDEPLDRVIAFLEKFRSDRPGHGHEPPIQEKE